MKLPDPLHPAIVHFPIVLILAGTLFAIICLFFRTRAMRWFAAILLLSGALGATAAVFTGEKAAHAAGDIPDTVERILDEHAEWGEGARNWAILAAVLSIATAATSRRTALPRVLAILTIVAACFSSRSVYEAGKHGGMLVYEHGVGVKIMQPAEQSVTPPLHKQAP
ncbi:MAG: DUF2231 domain-containing protein [Chthoniobacterales bacterium]